jgi:hypothetical protein
VRNAPEFLGLCEELAGLSQKLVRFFQALVGLVAHLVRFFPNSFSLCYEPCGCLQDFCNPLS